MGEPKGSFKSLALHGLGFGARLLLIRQDVQQAGFLFIKKAPKLKALLMKLGFLKKKRILTTGSGKPNLLLA
jgi:hypothetical protein